jgi:metal-responsive CopG/Arc/MetJ family transcriptional regulator
MRKAASSKQKRPRSRRTSISLPSEVYDTVERMAARQKVSFAWLVRDAVEKYVAERWPLLENR